MTKERDIRDHWFREAKRHGYRSRAAFKLIEIDDKKKVVPRGAAVLDCGCAPGSWLQVAAKLVGDRGTVVGIDLKTIRPLDKGSGGFDHVTVLHGDLVKTPAEQLLAAAGVKAFDVVLSDMAPNTTGDRTIDHHGSMNLCHAVVDRCRDVLKKGGTVVLKALEGAAYPELLDRVRATFDSCRGFKPKASRAISTEMFVIGEGYRGAASDPYGSDGDAEVVVPVPPKPKPAPGWGH